MQFPSGAQPAFISYLLFLFSTSKKSLHHFIICPYFTFLIKTKRAGVVIFSFGQEGDTKKFCPVKNILWGMGR